MSEAAILKKIMLSFCRGPVRLFRNNVARAWVGEIVGRTKDTITLRNPRPLHAGLHKGSGDLIGWRTITITPEMVGARVAVFVSVEVKTATGASRKGQPEWASAVIAAGGLAGIARSPEDAAAILDKLPVA